MPPSLFAKSAHIHTRDVTDLTPLYTTKEVCNHLVSRCSSYELHPPLAQPILPKKHEDPFLSTSGQGGNAYSCCSLPYLSAKKNREGSDQNTTIHAQNCSQAWP